MFYQNLIRLCTERGTTPTEVCHSIGLAGSAATKWKSGAIPRDTTLKKIADYFCVSVDDLIGEQPFHVDLDLQRFAEKEKEPTNMEALNSLINDMDIDELLDLQKKLAELLRKKWEG